MFCACISPKLFCLIASELCNKTDQEIIKAREWIPYIGLLPKVIPLKLFLDLEPSPSKDDTRATRGQPKGLSRKYPRQNGGKCSKTFHTTDVFCTPSRRFFQWAFVCFVPV